jgi:hypothetical protein
MWSCGVGAPPRHAQSVWASWPCGPTRGIMISWDGRSRCAAGLEPPGRGRTPRGYRDRVAVMRMPPACGGTGGIPGRRLDQQRTRDARGQPITTMDNGRGGLEGEEQRTFGIGMLLSDSSKGTAHMMASEDEGSRRLEGCQGKRASLPLGCPTETSIEIVAGGGEGAGSSCGDGAETCREQPSQIVRYRFNSDEDSGTLGEV